MAGKDRLGRRSVFREDGLGMVWQAGSVTDVESSQVLEWNGKADKVRRGAAVYALVGRDWRGRQGLVRTGPERSGRDR
jgi:hypothetical protein